MFGVRTVTLAEIVPDTSSFVPGSAVHLPIATLQSLLAQSTGVLLDATRCMQVRRCADLAHT